MITTHQALFPALSVHNHVARFPDYVQPIQCVLYAWDNDRLPATMPR
ncbi:MAG TPA: hypothetical protein VGF67_05620 [Ktedonobacteraceae bacterium]|jgi:hypothetical protein